jgi:hypothetical protein
MDELTLIRSFDEDVRSDESALAGARRALIAHIERRSVPFWRRRRIAVAAIALAALALAAAAFGSRLIDLFEGTPASPAVKRELKLEIAGLQKMVYRGPFAPVPGGYRTAKTRGIMTLRTPLGRVYLWGVFTKAGNVCTAFEGATRGKPYLENGLCIGKKTSQPPILWAITPVGFGDLSEAETPSVSILYGHLTRRVASVDFRAAHGGSKRLRIVEGFFAVRLPPLYADYTLVGRDGAGHELDRERVHVTGETSGPLLPVLGRAQILVEINSRQGEPIALILNRCPHGGAALDFLAGGGGSVSCSALAPAFRRTARIGVGFGGGGSASFIHGDAGERTAKLEIVYRDNTAVMVTTPRGWILYELPAGRAFKDIQELVAFDSQGRKVSSEPLPRNLFRR